ncbi:MAG: tRNA (adenosine(37)-N6)-threonylcarbamoyltransferase complex dimerization subunit type 1 TsaB [Stenotrophobium sp.]
MAADTMKILAIDTATEACSVALWLDGEIHAHFEVAGREHTQRLLPMVQALMAECGVAHAQLDGIACGVGPGSFAGVRIGVGFVKGLALALNRPVIGVSSLAMLAQGAIREHNAQNIFCVIDARMNEVYCGAYERGAQGLAQALMPETVGAAKKIPPLPAGRRWLGAGTGLAAYAEVLAQAAGAQIAQMLPQALPCAEDALRLALPEFKAGRGIDADLLTPVYLRDKVALTLVEQAALRK